MKKLLTCCAMIALLGSVAWAARIKVVDRESFLPGITEAGNLDDDFDNGDDSARAVARFDTENGIAVIRSTGKVTNASGERTVIKDDAMINAGIEMELGAALNVPFANTDTVYRVRKKGGARLTGATEVATG